MDELIIDRQLPVFDVTISTHRIVDADVANTWKAAHDLDFMRVHTPLLATSMWLRGLPSRLTGHAPPVAELKMAAEAPMPGWLVLGETRDREISFGAVGRFWQPAIEWRDVPPEGFASFTEPGYGKIACSFIIRPHGSTRSLLTYECRTATTDHDSHRKFARYWRLVRPFVGHIMRATTETIALDAERAAIPPIAEPATGVAA